MEKRICKICKIEFIMDNFPLDKRDGSRLYRCRKCHYQRCLVNHRINIAKKNGIIPIPPDLRNEIWKEIPNYPYYKASTKGRVKVCKHGYEKILKEATDHLGRKQICLTNNKKAKRFRTHQLVALTFIPNTNNRKEINHIDGNPSNNCVENLEWCTRSENMLHAHRVLRQKPIKQVPEKKGINHTNSKMVLQLSLDGFIINVFDSYSIAALETNGNIQCIGLCVSGKLKTSGGYKWL